MRKVACGILLGLFMCSVLGCSKGLVRVPGASGRTLVGRADVSTIDPNRLPYSVEVIRRSDGSQDILWEVDGDVEQKQPCRVKYHELYSANGYMVVECKIGSPGTRYPVVLDTGASQPLFVKVLHVLENELAIYPLENDPHNINGYGLGLCHLPELQIGNVTLADWPCLYLERPTKLTLLGLAIAHDGSEDNTVIVGLPVLREFKYIVFDNINEEVEFSYRESFGPGEPSIWEKYPFSVEEDFHGNAFLLVRVPVAGEDIELQLDTGSGRGLVLKEDCWERIRNKIQVPKLEKGRQSYPYVGRLPCRQGVVAKLNICERTVRNAEISIFANGSPLLRCRQGLLGMQYFQDTVMVIDFDRDIMWVKHPRSR